MTGTPPDGAIDRFVARLRARLVAGAATYGNASFQRPAAELVDEVQQELEDVCSWSLILWIRLERLRGRVGAPTGGRAAGTPGSGPAGRRSSGSSSKTAARLVARTTETTSAGPTAATA